MVMSSLGRSARTDVAGRRGPVGGAVLAPLRATGFSDLVTRTSAELDVRDPVAVEFFFADQQPATVVVAAATVGTLANNTFSAKFLSDNVRIQVNVFTRQPDMEQSSCCSLARAACAQSSHQANPMGLAPDRTA